jgi:hypothetical protein
MQKKLWPTQISCYQNLFVGLLFVESPFQTEKPLCFPKAFGFEPKPFRLVEAQANRKQNH